MKSVRISALGLLFLVQGIALSTFAQGFGIGGQIVAGDDDCETTDPTDPPDTPRSVCDGVENAFCLTPDPDCVTRSTPKYGLEDTTVKEYIVAMHNMFRSKVAAGGELRGSPGPQPPTECMSKLTWDDDLATAAQNVADQCDLFNTYTLNNKLGPIPNGMNSAVGQNSYVMIEKYEQGGLKAPSLFPDLYYWNLTLNTWYAEITRFSNAKVKAYRATVANNYTQMVWGATTNVGCGFRRAKLPNEDTGDHGRMLLCYYWPAGNQVGQEVYIQRPLKAPYPACPTCKSNFQPTVFVNTTMNGELCVYKKPAVLPCNCDNGGGWPTTVMATTAPTGMVVPILPAPFPPDGIVLDSANAQEPPTTHLSFLTATTMPASTPPQPSTTTTSSTRRG